MVKYADIRVGSRFRYIQYVWHFRIKHKAWTLLHKHTRKIVVDLIAFYLVQYKRESEKRRKFTYKYIFMTLFSPLFSYFSLNFSFWMIRIFSSYL